MDNSVFLTSQLGFLRFRTITVNATDTATMKTPSKMATSLFPEEIAGKVARDVSKLLLDNVWKLVLACRCIPLKKLWGDSVIPLLSTLQYSSVLLSPWVVM